MALDVDECREEAACPFGGRLVDAGEGPPERADRVDVAGAEHDPLVRVREQYRLVDASPAALFQKDGQHNPLAGAHRHGRLNQHECVWLHVPPDRVHGRLEGGEPHSDLLCTLSDAVFDVEGDVDDDHVR